MPNPKRAPARLNQEPSAVRWARKRSGLTQTQLAERAGVSRTLVVEIEGGTRSATDGNLIKLAEAMNCPVVVLERKRESEAAPAPVSPVLGSGLRSAERTESRDVPEMRSEAVATQSGSA